MHGLLDTLGDPEQKTLLPGGRRKRKGAANSDEEACMSANVFAGMHSVDNPWQRNKSEWPLEDVPVGNRGNSRLTDQVPATVEGKKAQPSNDPRYNRRHSQAHIELSQTTVREW